MGWGFLNLTWRGLCSEREPDRTIQIPIGNHTHPDIKIQNILVNNAGEIKITFLLNQLYHHFYRSELTKIVYP